MKKILSAAGSAVKRVGAAVLGVYKRYPARCTSYIVSGVVIAAGALGLVVDQASAKTIVEIVLPILVTGEATHHRVSPVR